MKQVEWLKRRHLSQVSGWTLDDALIFLFMSESTQKKLPGAETAGQIKDILKERVTQLVEGMAGGQVAAASSTTTKHDANITTDHDIIVADIIRLLLTFLAPALTSLFPQLHSADPVQFRADLCQYQDTLRRILATISTMSDTPTSHRHQNRL